jgi:large-conductance mechanosensitive channel
MSSLGIILVFAIVGVVVFLLVRQQNASKKETVYFDIDHKYAEEKAKKQKEVDRILDKISKRGLDSLSASEKATLEEFRKK